MSELDNLLNALRNMKEEEKSKIKNSKDIWSLIGKQKFTEAGFASEEEAIAWMENNPYLNLV